MHSVAHSNDAHSGPLIMRREQYIYSSLRAQLWATVQGMELSNSASGLFTGKILNGRDKVGPCRELRCKIHYSGASAQRRCSATCNLQHTMKRRRTRCTIPACSVRCTLVQRCALRRCSFKLQ